MRKKPTLIVAGLVVAGIGGALGGASTVGASAPVASAPAGGAIDCAAIASSFGGEVPESLATFYSAVNSSNSQIATADTPLTLFIPANTAFDKIPSNVLDVDHRGRRPAHLDPRLPPDPRPGAQLGRPRRRRHRDVGRG